jgi:molecular chaperone DnaJ
MQSPWATLGVSPETPQDEVKKAYKKLALKYHPDRNPGDGAAEEKFKEVTAAYEAITKGTARQGHEFSTDDMLNDIFSQFGFNSRAPQQYAEIEPIGLTVRDYALGAEKKARIRVTGPCRTCSGIGATPGNYTDCTSCRGTGQATFKQGFVTVSMGKCSACNGVGRAITKSCGPCSGRGNATSESVIDVNIPPGAGGGNLHVNYMGSRLAIPMFIQPDEVLSIDGLNVRSKVVLTLKQALFGCKLQIETVSGTKTVSVEPLKFGDAELRLRGLGVQASHPGDHILDVRVTMPDEETRKKMKEALDE